MFLLWYIQGSLVAEPNTGADPPNCGALRFYDLFSENKGGFHVPAWLEQVQPSIGLPLNEVFVLRQGEGRQRDGCGRVQGTGHTEPQ